jgi:hypothetical protein
MGPWPAHRALGQRRGAPGLSGLTLGSEMPMVYMFALDFCPLSYVKQRVFRYFRTEFAFFALGAGKQNTYSVLSFRDVGTFLWPAYNYSFFKNPPVKSLLENSTQS